MNRTWHAWEGNELHENVWWENLKETESLKDLGIDGRILK